MKTVEHKLLSEPEKIIKLPKEYVKIADNLIKDLRDLKHPNDVRHVVARYGYSGDIKIHNAAYSFVESISDIPRQQKMNDKIHILISMLGVTKETEASYIKLEEKYKKNKEKLQRENDSMYDRLAWHLVHLK